MTLTITRSIPSFPRHSFPKLHLLNVQLGLLPSSAQKFLPRPTLAASKAYRSPNPPQAFISMMPPRKAKRKLGQFVSDTITQAQASPKKLRQQISRNLSTIGAMPSTPSPAANDDGINYRFLASFAEQQMKDPKPITPLQRRLLTELTSSFKDEEPDTSGHDWVSLLQRYTDTHNAQQAGTSIEYRDEAAASPFNAAPTLNTKWACTLTFQISRNRAPQMFPLPHQLVPGGFAKKKDAKKYAAKCCVEWLMSQYLMPKDGIKVTFPQGSKLMMSSSDKIYGPLSQQPPSSSSPVPVSNPHLAAQLGHYPSSSTSPTPSQSRFKQAPAPAPPPNPSQSALSLQDNGGAPLGPPEEDFDGEAGETPSRRVAALCEKLGLRPPRYVLTQRRGQEGVFDGYADMGPDSWIVPFDIKEKDFGRVEGVYSKKFAKDMIAQEILGLLFEIGREREVEAREMLGGD